jgi:uncharacterized protein CbrC (UPF0167 family)
VSADTPDLPRFPYHPDPLQTGSVVPSDVPCVCCRQKRGYIYVGPVYALEELHEQLCPWCIADGSAHDRLDASFVDEGGVGGYGDWAPVPRSVVEELAFRTPSFSGWQQEKWFTCCNDAAEFLGLAGARELQGAWAPALEAIRSECALEGREWDEYRSALDRENSPTAYVFRCRHCGRYGGYSDCD